MAYKIENPGSAAGEIIAQEITAGKTKKGKQAKADAAEQQRRGNEMQTQGRAGCKLGRMNLSLSPDNFEYVRTRARMDATTLSKAVNAALTEAREKAEKDPAYIAARDVFREYDAKEAKQ